MAVSDHRDDELDPRLAAVLAVADAYLSDPTSLTGERRDAVRKWLDEDEIATVALMVAVFSRDKVNVALNLDVEEAVRWTE